MAWVRSKVHNRRTYRNMGNFAWLFIPFSRQIPLYEGHWQEKAKIEAIWPHKILNERKNEERRWAPVRWYNSSWQSGFTENLSLFGFPSWRLDLFASDLTHFALNDFDLYIFFSSGPPIRSVGKQFKYETVQFERYNNSKGADDRNDYYKWIDILWGRFWKIP